MPTFSIHFPNIREHILRKPRGRKTGLSRYERQQHSRKLRQKDMSEEKENFFRWIDEIQKKLNLNNYEFALRCNVSWQTRMLWFRRSGHFPSQKSYVKLLELEKEARLTIKDFKIIIRISG